MVYNFMITEYLLRSVKVEAQSEDEAYQIVKNFVNNEKLVLTADDFCYCNIDSMSTFIDGQINTDEDFSKNSMYLKYIEHWKKGTQR